MLSYIHKVTLFPEPPLLLLQQKIALSLKCYCKQMMCCFQLNFIRDFKNADLRLL